jgi:anti-anti-sigma factor
MRICSVTAAGDRPDEGPAGADEHAAVMADCWSPRDHPTLYPFCSPHKVAVAVLHLRDYYKDDLAAELVAVLPEWIRFLAEHTCMAAELTERCLAYAAGDLQFPVFHRGGWQRMPGSRQDHASSSLRGGRAAPMCAACRACNAHAVVASPARVQPPPAHQAIPGNSWVGGNIMSTTLLPMTAVTQLHIDTSYPSPNTARAAVAGEVDLATAPVLTDRLLGLLDGRAPAVLEVDLAGCTFLDCTGIGALVGVRNAAVQTGCQMRVIHPQPVVRRVLDLTGLLDVLTAPIDQPQPLPTRSEYPARIGPASATVTTSLDILVAA